MKPTQSTMKLSLCVVVAILSVGHSASSTGSSQYVAVGCFKDELVQGQRALPELLANYRGKLDWNNLNQYVEKCALEAKKRNYMHFGVQFYGECWSGPYASLTYDRYGPSSQCISNVGMGLANFVYRFIGDEEECLDYSILNFANRSSLYQLPNGIPPSCDSSLSTGWYRFLSPAGKQMASTCIQSGKCGTVVTGWLRSVHPKTTDGIVNRNVCFTWGSECCKWSQEIKVRDCGRFFVYKLQKPIGCPMRFCGQ